METFVTFGANRTGASPDGRYAFVELIGPKDVTLAVLFPPEAAIELAHRFLSAAEFTSKQAIPLPLVTDHHIDISDDHASLVLTLQIKHDFHFGWIRNVSPHYGPT